MPTDTRTEANPYAVGRVGADSTLEVMTWNIQNFAKQGAVTAAEVIKVVEGLDVDIIALQEIENLAYFQQVREGLADWTGDRATSAAYQVNLAFLYPLEGEVEVTSVYEILTGARTELPRSPLVLEATFHGREFVVINNHYKCCGDNVIQEGDTWDEEWRRLGASRLLDEFIRTNYADKQVIMVGDFNDELSDDPEDNVFAPFLDDPDTYRFVDMNIALTPGALWSYPSWPSHIDHILITSGLFAAHQDARTSLTRVVPLHDYLGEGWTSYKDKVSDHLPVVLRLAP